MKTVTIPQDLFETIMLHLNDMEHASFIEEGYNPDGQINHVYLVGLTAQLHAAEPTPGFIAPFIGIDTDIASELLTLKAEGYELPFEVCRKVEGETATFEPVDEVGNETILFGVLAEHFAEVTV